MKQTDIYHRWVAWSEEDQAYVGHCPDLFSGGVHGDDPLEVARQLQEAIDDWERILEDDEAPFPPVRVRPSVEYV